MRAGWRFDIQSALKAAFAYFAIVFAIGFVLGTLRVVALAPHLGDALAVVVELPLMLAISWMSCSWIINHFSVPRAWTPRLTMGGVAFCVLIGAEIGVSVFGFKRSIVEHFATYQTASSIMGLLGQIAFALFPVIQWRVRSNQPDSD